jgi:putative transposase
MRHGCLAGFRPTYRLTPVQESALRDTLALCNHAANLTSREAFDKRVYAKHALQRVVYGELKRLGLSAQPAIHVA